MTQSNYIGTERTHDFNVVGILERKTCAEQVGVRNLHKSEVTRQELISLQHAHIDCN